MPNRQDDDFDPSDVKFFRPCNPVNIQLSFDPGSECFIAKATLANTGEALIEGTSEDDAVEAVEQVIVALSLMCDKPKMFNGRLRAIAESYDSETVQDDEEEAAVSPKSGNVRRLR